MKHIILSSLALLMAASLPFMAKAQYFEVDGITYNVLSLTSHTVEVSPSISCNYYSGNINIPSTVTYDDTIYDVVALGEQAFLYASLSGISIPTSVTHIKRGCFQFGTRLSSITIPASVTIIEEMALSADDLTAINVDANNPNYRSIEGVLFSKDTSTIVECPVKKSGTFTLPSNTKHIASSAFVYCNKLTGVVIPDGLQSIGEAAFFGAKRLNNITIPESVSFIGTNLFGDCTALENLSLAEGNMHYYQDGMAIYSIGGDTLVSYHKSADSVFLPATVRVVDGFLSNHRIKYVHVPEGATQISGNAFENSSLASIDLPSHMHSIGDWTFYNCKSLTRVGMPATLDTMGEGCFHSCNRLTSIVIPDGLSIVPNAAFFMCNSLSDVTWGNAVEIIDTCAFGNCALADLTIPPTIRTVRSMAFIGSYQKRLKRLSFSAPVDTIEQGAFYQQPLKMLRLRNTQPPTTTIYDTYGCLDGTNLDSIVVPCGSLNAWLADSYWGQFADKLVEDCYLGIGEVADMQITVYPNPTTGIVQFQGLDEDVQSVTLYDMAGHLVATFRNTSTLNIAHLPAGSYIASVLTPSGPHNLRLIKK